MQIILLVVVGFVLLLVLLFSVINIAVSRVTAPMEDVNEKIADLEKRIDELEKDD